MANLTDADKVLRNDTGKSIVSKLDGIKDAIVAQGGGAHSLDQLSDVDIDSQTLAAGQSIVYNDVTEKFENGEVSTVAALDDLTDVDIDSQTLAAGDSLRNDGNGNWINEPTTVAMTQDDWDDIQDKSAWRNAHTNTHLVITDAPNLNATAQNLSYDGGVTSTYDEVENIKDTALQMATFDFTKTINATTQAIYYILRSDFNLPTGAKVKSCFLRENTYNSVNAGGLVYSARANETATNAIDGAIYNGTNTNRTYNITATVFYTLS